MNVPQRAHDIAPSPPSVLAATPDAGFAREIAEALGHDERFALALHHGPVDTLPPERADEAALVLADLDETGESSLEALRSMTARPAGTVWLAVTRTLDAGLARGLLRLKVADLLVKPVAEGELAAACLRALGATATAASSEAEIVAFLPAMGGVGCSTLAVQTAVLFQDEGRRAKSAACLVDLDLQQGVCAEYLDLEPRLDLAEIDPHPERLDRQLLEVMMSRHRCGLSVIAAPGRPAETRGVAPRTVSRLLDLVAANFDHVVIDLPRNWSAWTDAVLQGCDRLFVVAEMTVPALRRARRLAAAIEERLGGRPRPGILVNRFESRLFGSGLRRGDVEEALGGFLAGTVANDYRLAREAIDQGVPITRIRPKNAIIADLRKLVLGPESKARRPRRAPGMGLLAGRAAAR